MVQKIVNQIEWWSMMSDIILGKEVSNMVQKYRKKPVVIEAIQWDGTSEALGEIVHWMNREVKNLEDNKLGIETLEGTMEASVGDFIIKGVHGEFYPCKPDIFEKTYERVDE